METGLKVGILNYSLSWHTVLNQIGVIFCRVPVCEEISPEQYSIIIVNRPVENNEKENIKRYIKKGGAVIDNGYCITGIVKGRLGKKRCSSIISGDLPFCNYTFILDLYSEVKTFSASQYLDKLLFIEEYGDGVISFLGLDIDKLLFDKRSKRKEFYAETQRFPNEEVSTVSKGEITRLVFCLMRHLHIIRGIPFVHKWFFPGRNENVFLFRVDSDYGNKKQIKNIYNVGEANNIRFTWFLHTEAHKEWLGIFSGYRPHEIAVHCHRHITSRKYHIQKENIQTALGLLKEQEIVPCGFSSPYGLWNEQVSNICSELGMQYSSEFGYCYDSLPMYPVVNGIMSPVLQIPIHPVCMGNLVNAKADEKDMYNYFINETRRNMLGFNPVVFYTHVVHKYTDVINEIFRHIRLLDIPSLTFCEFAEWWKERESTVYSAMVDSSGDIILKASNKKDACNICVWNDNDKYLLTGMDSVVKKDAQTNKVHIYEMPNMTELSRTRGFKPRLCKISVLTKLLWRKSK